MFIILGVVKVNAMLFETRNPKIVDNILFVTFNILWSIYFNAISFIIDYIGVNTNKLHIQYNYYIGITIIQIF